MVINILSLNYTTNILFILGLIILILISIKIYINIINKSFKLKYPCLYYLLNIGSSFLLAICVSLVLMFPYGGSKGSLRPSSGGSSGGPGNNGGPGGFNSKLEYSYSGKKRNSTQKRKSDEFIRSRNRAIKKHKEFIKDEVDGKPCTEEMDEILIRRTQTLKFLLEDWKHRDRLDYPNIDNVKLKDIDDMNFNEFIKKNF